MLLCSESGWYLFLAANKQLYKWFSPPVCLSVCPPVTHFSLCSHHRIIITRTKKKIDDCDPNRAFPDCNYSSSWIHRRLWNDAQRLEGVGRGSLLCFKVLNQISMSHGPKNQQFHGFWIWFEQDYKASRRYKIPHICLVEKLLPVQISISTKPFCLDYWLNTH